LASTPPEPFQLQPPPSARKLAESARLTWLASRLAGRADSAELLGRASELEAALGKALWTLRQPNMTLTSRAGAAAELVRLRSELDALVASAGAPVSSRAPGVAPPPAMRERLAHLLNVPLTSAFDGLIDAKIAEHHEQLGAFDYVANLFGFKRAQGLGQGEPRGALALTANASIVQLSAPRREGDIEVRRYVYQGIYGASVPSEGRLSLTDSLRLGQPLRSAAFTTSPICELRLPEAAAPWEKERKLSTTLERVFGAAAMRRTAWGADPGWVPSVVLAKPAEEHERLGVTARVQLVSALGRLQRAPDPVLEAEVLGLCLYLQHLAVERGARGVQLAQVKSFTGAAGDRCQVSERVGRRVLALDRPGHSRLELLDVAIGDQLLVVGTPVALLDAKGSIAAVIGEVRSIHAR
jgi:hypothetical protein